MIRWIYKCSKGSHIKNMTNCGKVHNFFEPPHPQGWFWKKTEIWWPPPWQKFGNIWNVDHFDIVAPPLTLAKKVSKGKKNFKGLAICPKWPYPTYLYPLIVGFWGFAYLYKYGHQYLTYLPSNFLSKPFLRKKKYGCEKPYLPLVWTYVQIFAAFFLDPSLNHI